MRVTIDFITVSWQQAQELVAKFEAQGIPMPDLNKRINTKVEVSEAQWQFIQQEEANLPHPRKIAWPTSY